MSKTYLQKASSYVTQKRVKMKSRLFIISNRLPINIETVDSEIKLNVSSGGLITAISSYIKYATEKVDNNLMKIIG
jgi:PII-like signaling protein